mmetsp:Transcript_23755/g.58749  ORF Transcript_23755/g.58749 Transcript_23755/m.58749 type:complete len:293 (-) Transcript_23755:1423-2301(-)
MMPLPIPPGRRQGAASTSLSSRESFRRQLSSISARDRAVPPPAPVLAAPPAAVRLAPSRPLGELLWLSQRSGPLLTRQSGWRALSSSSCVVVSWRPCVWPLSRTDERDLDGVLAGFSSLCVCAVVPRPSGSPSHPSSASPPAVTWAPPVSCCFSVVLDPSPVLSMSKHWVWMSASPSWTAMVPWLDDSDTDQSDGPPSVLCESVCGTVDSLTLKKPSVAPRLTSWFLRVGVIWWSSWGSTPFTWFLGVLAPLPPGASRMPLLSNGGGGAAPPSCFRPPNDAPTPPPPPDDTP